MRNVLAPTRQARYIPWKRASQRAKPFIAEPARPDPSDQDALEHPAVLAARARAAAAARATNVGETPTEMLSKLLTLPTQLTFARRTISPETPALHGSLTLNDVAEHIAKLQGLTGNDVEVNWVGHEVGERMKELGSWEASVAIKGYGGESVNVEVEVVRQE
ncbi:hypothetical protein A1Q1_04875 [Trichosporon asahii var. asahii CBS 2479]|nr:hypothetical protein A1Q1_04875 [Trichosporon asahii var. asahii CBS 2479]EJT46508.1 hypothetical protein A1Q1_04875 [Trichosporon asahii var. asahii CBS 2479]